MRHPFQMPAAIISHSDRSERKAASCDVLIVGGGSRALLIIERLAIHLARTSGNGLDVVVVEPEELGPGIHRPDQGSHIRFNTPSSCPTLFSNRSLAGIGEGISGPTFREWAGISEETSWADFQPRARVGEYLLWCAKHILAQLPPAMRLTHVHDTVSSVSLRPDGTPEFLTASGMAICPRACILAIGHSLCGRTQRLGLESAKGHQLVANPFPTHSRLAGIGEKHVVAVRGMGLTAQDVVAELTVGRGGHFVQEPSGELRYIASRHQPEIFLFSRTGIPIRTRPDPSQRASDSTLRVLDKARLLELAARDSKLSFRNEVYPLLLAEMTCRMLSRAPHERSPLPSQLRAWWNQAGWSESATKIAAQFRIREVEDYFSGILRPINDELGNAAGCAAAFLRADLKEGARGTAGSALKHALEALLEARCFIKALCDYRNDLLTDPGWLYTAFASIVNRNVIGPHAERGAELLALIECGSVQIAPAGSEVFSHSEQASDSYLIQPSGAVLSQVDFLIAADRLRMATDDQSSFTESLFSIGLGCPVDGEDGSPLGIRVDRELRVVPSKELLSFPLWALGPPCEGSSYYNNYLPCLQGDAIFPYQEADLIAAGALRTLC